MRLGPVSQLDPKFSQNQTKKNSHLFRRILFSAILKRSRKKIEWHSSMSDRKKKWGEKRYDYLIEGSRNDFCTKSQGYRPRTKKRIEASSHSSVFFFQEGFFFTQIDHSLSDPIWIYWDFILKTNRYRSMYGIKYFTQIKKSRTNESLQKSCIDFS